MPDLEYVQGLIFGATKLINRIEHSRTALAKKLLDKTYHEVPRPPWNTGALRSSGRAYVNQKLVARTPETGPNPKGPANAPRVAINYRTGETYRVGGLSRGSVPLDYTPTGFGILPKSQSGEDTIAVVYMHPVASMMHEWEGGFSDNESGAYYISAKLVSIGPDFYTIMGSVFK